MRRLARLDRRLGAAARAAAAAVPGAPGVARVGARAMSPGFRIVVALLIASRRRRALGLRTLAAAVSAAMLARVLRDRLGRRRPGARAEGGFPSRHAAASAAIATTVLPAAPGLGTALAAAAAAGGAARVVTAEHEPADIAAGAALGVGIGFIMGFAARQRHGNSGSTSA